MSAPKIKSPPTEASGKPSSDSSQVRRVSPYPIDVSIFKVEGQPPARAQIVKMTEIGFLIKADETQFYKVGENYTAHFEIPVTGESVKVSVKVVKTYDAMEMANKSEKTKMRTIEMHFKTISDRDRGHINTYLVKSGQRK
ncbi:MAG: hypothetical protein ACAH59_01475 [Pseudobdellovibrionaceae bacterium]